MVSYAIHVRVAELSRRSGVPVPTIKYYLREGLLPAGEFSSPNQARYGERHLRRLQLIRALLEIGRLPIVAIKDVLSDVDRPNPDIHYTLGKALMRVAGGPGTTDEAAVAEVDEFIAERGWLVGPDAPARQALAEVVSALRVLGHEAQVERLDDYAAAAQRMAEVDLEITGRHSDPDEIVYSALIGTVLGDAMIVALRHLAQEDASARTFGLSTAPEC